MSSLAGETESRAIEDKCVSPHLADTSHKPNSCSQLHRKVCSTSNLADCLTPIPRSMAVQYKYDQQACTSVVVQAQPTAATTTYVPPSGEVTRGFTTFALGLSISALGGSFFSLFSLVCSIPALILAIVAVKTTGAAQKASAGVSIALSVVTYVCVIVLISVAYVYLYAASVTVSRSSYRYSYRYSG